MKMATDIRSIIKLLNILASSGRRPVGRKDATHGASYLYLYVHLERDGHPDLEVVRMINDIGHIVDRPL